MWCFETFYSDAVALSSEVLTCPNGFKQQINWDFLSQKINLTEMGVILWDNIMSLCRVNPLTAFYSEYGMIHLHLNYLSIYRSDVFHSYLM